MHSLFRMRVSTQTILEAHHSTAMQELSMDIHSGTCARVTDYVHCSEYGQTLGGVHSQAAHPDLELDASPDIIYTYIACAYQQYEAMDAVTAIHLLVVLPFHK